MGTGLGRFCVNCKWEHTEGKDYPCRDCHINDKEKWEPKEEEE